MTAAVLGAGSQLKLSDMAGTPVFTLIAEVLNVGPIGSTAPEVDVTNLDSTAKEYIGGLPDGESVDFELNFVAGNTEHEVLRDATGQTKDFEMLWNDGSQAAFSLVVLGFQRGETTPEGQLKASLSGRITGDITWT